MITLFYNPKFLLQKSNLSSQQSFYYFAWLACLLKISVTYTFCCVHQTEKKTEKKVVAAFVSLNQIIFHQTTKANNPQNKFYRKLTVQE